MEPIPIVDVRKGYRETQGEIDRAVAETLASGEYCLGSQVAAFEAEVASYLGVPFAIGVSSGTDAILLALTELAIGPGDEVISPAFTFIATATPIIRLGARPVFVDVAPDGYQMDPRAMAAAITPRTRAIIPVHLYGSPAPISEYAAAIEGRSKPISIVEDACQAIGSRIDGKAAGTIGIWGCYSFYPTKNLPACGDAGLMVTHDPQRAERARRLRAHGVEEGRAYHHSMVGFNARLDGLQAAILRVRLRRLDSWNAARDANARLYREAFAASGLPERADPRTGSPALRLPPPPGRGDTTNHHQFAVRASRRDELKARLLERGIQSAVFYPTPLPFQPAFQSLGHRPGDFPHSEALAREVLCLPIHHHLSPDDVHRVVEEIVAFYAL
jgi:dTDP-4-amino-4,6-dideoxygalactose transaminase